MHERTSPKAARVGDLIPTKVDFMGRNGELYTGLWTGGKEENFLLCGWLGVMTP
jgi:hypothetical protein